MILEGVPGLCFQLGLKFMKKKKDFWGTILISSWLLHCWACVAKHAKTHTSNY